MLKTLSLITLFISLSVSAQESIIKDFAEGRERLKIVPVSQHTSYDKYQTGP